MYEALKSYWLLDRGDNNRKTLVGMAKRWPQLLDEGGHIIEIEVSFNHLVVGGRLTGGCLMEVQFKCFV